MPMVGAPVLSGPTYGRDRNQTLTACLLDAGKHRISKKQKGRGLNRGCLAKLSIKGDHGAETVTIVFAEHRHVDERGEPAHEGDAPAAASQLSQGCRQFVREHLLRKNPPSHLTIQSGAPCAQITQHSPILSDSSILRLQTGGSTCCGSTLRLGSILPLLQWQQR